MRITGLLLITFTSLACGGAGSPDTSGTGGNGGATGGCRIDADCDDRDACNGSETCNANGRCQQGTALTIDDGDACTKDACDAATGKVTHAAISGCKTCKPGDSCDDGDACTKDSCGSNGACAHEAIGHCKACESGKDCSDGRLCDGGLCQTVTRLTTSGTAACAILETGAAQCWGGGSYGELADGKRHIRTTAAPIAVAGPFVDIALQNGDGVAVLASGRVIAWGDDEDGQLGNGMVGKLVATPGTVGNLDTGGVNASISISHGCAITDDGGIPCWGAGEQGASCGQTYCLAAAPVQDALFPGKATRTGSGDRHSCALFEDGEVFCWGDNQAGEHGIAPSTTLIEPSQVPLGGRAVELTVRDESSCAILDDGKLICWGGAFPSPPIEITGLHGATTVSHSGSRICGVVGGALLCQGSNPHGELGDGTTNDSLMTPISVHGFTSGVRAVSVGSLATCAIADVGGVTGAFCWGDNEYGQIGDGTKTERHVPTAVR